MMVHKHLHELLKEDQEPFLLKNYIFDRRSQLNRPIPKTKSQPNKFRSIVEIANSKRSLWNQACFSSLHHSPFADFPRTATAKSPCNCKSRNTVMLLEAAMRITQKQSSVSKPKTQIKNAGFRLFGSVLQRLRGKTRCRKRDIGAKSGFEMGFGCSCNNRRRSSAFWSESSKGKSRDVQTYESKEIIGSAVEERGNGDFSFSEKSLCSSPFRFSLQKSPCSSPRKLTFSLPATSPRKLNLSPPATSPLRYDKQDNCGIEGIQKIQLEKEQEEKEQCSPVSVLDPPFEDDEERHEDGDEADGYDLECSYAIVQRSKQQLLHKLCRFETLAELGPIELEKIMLEDQKEEDDPDDVYEEDQQCEDQFSSAKIVDRFVRQVKSGLRPSGDSVDMKRLIVDLIREESREKEGEGGGINDSEMVVKRICERLDSWKEVQSNTIDMMVELDFRRDVDGWKRNDGELTAVEIEISIFGKLVEELSQEI